MPKILSDASPIYSALGADPDLAEIVDMFVEEIPDRIATLRLQFQAADWEELRRTAHQLKGAAGSYGFSPVTPTAAAVEDAVRNAAGEREIQEALDALIDVCQRIRSGTPQ